jgi:hypothetical protein
MKPKDKDVGSTPAWLVFLFFRHVFVTTFIPPFFYTSTMPVLTLRLYLRDAYENNEFFDTI